MWFLLLMLPEHMLLGGLPDLMANVAREEMEGFNGIISECNIVYYPQVIVYTLFEIILMLTLHI